MSAQFLAMMQVLANEARVTPMLLDDGPNINVQIESLSIILSPDAAMYLANKLTDAVDELELAEAVSDS